MTEARESWRVPTGQEPQRLDTYVASHLEQPRNQVQRWIRDAALTVDGKAVKPSLQVLGGERIELARPPRTDSRVTPEDGELEVLYQDQDLIVLNKPAGMAVHPGAGRAGGTLVHRLLHHYPEIEGVGGEGRPGIVHRLDLGTSGVMMVARTDAAYQALIRSFQKRQVEKTYLGICEGRPSPDRGSMTWPIARNPRRRKQMQTVADGRPAHTDYRVLATARRSALLELNLHTGRTHQIRVHLKALGHPLLGDHVYGRALPRNWPNELRAAVEALPRPALHAWRLRLPHPATAEPVEFHAPPTADLKQLWDDLGGDPQAWPDFDAQRDPERSREVAKSKDLRGS